MKSLNVFIATLSNAALTWHLCSVYVAYFWMVLKAIHCEME